MSRVAQVEEVSDSDPEEVAPSDNLPSNARDSILSGAGIPQPGAAPTPTPSSIPVHPAPAPEPQREIPRHFQCLYPVYFDKTRSRAEGRKVGTELAVENPLAREIVDAVQVLGLQVGLEPEKLHPKDWANPGRVRVLLKNGSGKVINPRIKNSMSTLVLLLELGKERKVANSAEHHLYILVAQYLKAHPTTEESPYRLRIRGLPAPEKLPDAPAAPRGWKMSKILPIHSPAYSGGGVSDNPLKDAMAEMQNLQGMPGMPQMPQMPGMPGMPGMGEPSAGGSGGGGGGGEKKKKDKKK